MLARSFAAIALTAAEAADLVALLKSLSGPVCESRDGRPC